MLCLQVVRRLVKDLFPDIHVLANSSCVGKRDGNAASGLDPKKVDAIKSGCIQIIYEFAYFCNIKLSIKKVQYVHIH